MDGGQISNFDFGKFQHIYAKNVKEILPIKLCRIFWSHFSKTLCSRCKALFLKVKIFFERSRMVITVSIIDFVQIYIMKNDLGKVPKMQIFFYFPLLLENKFLLLQHFKISFRSKGCIAYHSVSTQTQTRVQVKHMQQAINYRSDQLKLKTMKTRHDEAE